MTNFDFLKQDEQFASFADVAITAEKILHIDADSCVINCRRAMEFAVKWMYSADSSLVMPPYQENLRGLMNDSDFRDIVGEDIWQRMDLIRKVGNSSAHGSRKVSLDEAKLCLENLFIFLDFVSYCYSTEYEERTFNPALLGQHTAPVVVKDYDVDFEKLVKENEQLKEELTATRQQRQQTYVPKPLDISEYKTRKIYIDYMLRDAGWTEGKDWFNEFELSGMPNQSEVGYADYVLFGQDNKPLAVLEAKRTCVDVSKGRQQAKLYADLLEKKYGRRPVIFLSNGFDTRIWDDKYYPERKVAAVYSRRDLEKLFNLRTLKTSLKNVYVNRNIAGRYYQEAAIKAVCKSFDTDNRRKALLVMATGSGKTRTVMALCDVLLQHGWVKNILFLADRNSLVTQAKRSFVNLLPDLSVTNLCEEKDNYDAHCVFSTYQTMMNVIDNVKDEDNNKLYTVGHFDLIICDEAHRSIYNKYRDIFNYFDAPIVGLTATPKDEIDKNTYEVFELANGMPTYAYDLAQAVKDGYLVDYISVETKLKFIEEGIAYEDLTDEEKAEYEATFTDENGELPDKINSSALNTWVFNEDTIRQVLNILMTKGLKVDYGQKIGKTIIFAKNHEHAEKILEVFGKEYPHLPSYAKVIDNYMTYAQSAIDEFSDPRKMPQIAISVDMLDTGIDVPEVLNLVFFKKVMSKAKFWQMIGRGTRLCPLLIDGKDKEIFYIFDFCNNFDFFRFSTPKPVPNMIALQGAVFHLKAQIAYKLQDLDYQTPDFIQFRKELVDDMVNSVRELNKENFAVRQHLKYVELYANADNYNTLTYENTLIMGQELAPLIQPYDTDAKAVRFDHLMYGIELAYLVGKKYARGRTELFKKVNALKKMGGTIPAIKEKEDLIQKILHTSYVEDAGINEFEHIREALRDLIKYIPREGAMYDTHFIDDIIDMVENESELDNDDLKNYKAKAEYYVRQHQDNLVIAKLKSNQQLTALDIKQLEDILWSELGTKQDYEAEYGQKPLGEFVRELVGLDMTAAKTAFAQYLDETVLDDRQIYFVNQIVEYIVHNGLMKDMSVLMSAPFTDRGSVVEVFTDLTVWQGIRKTIEQINANALLG
ncbi:MAG: DEAD/DEAH box helicase family protein [Oscillospiraceae bacterium]|nr:DEAD/DEAH box helicase family protein [Oscillospiraceae bacterium]